MVIVKTTDLLKMAQDILDSGYEYVEMNEVEADKTDAELPACISFDAYDGHGVCVDFYELEHLDISPTYKED
ncbi:hypothetical protein [Acetobacterium sp.]|uniref:hypothetical protein n=1 Tax=Acetobacterium sp. TaxID=1872094 RepID=UPI00271FC2D0|nr:hypothetical protein [Acetobacterium sp.]MDO9492561.1 hypothetical protein [Acetobacterium sp.]